MRNKKMIGPQRQRKGSIRKSRQAYLRQLDAETIAVRDELKDLIEKTYGDREDEIKAQITAGLEDIPDADDKNGFLPQVKCLNAIKAVYQEAIQEIKDGGIER